MNLFSSLLKIKAYNTTNHSRYFYYILILVILSYLILGVGLHGDDYVEIYKRSGVGLWEFLNPQIGMQVSGLPNYYTFAWAFTVLGFEYQWLYYVIKIIVHACINNMSNDFHAPSFKISMNAVSTQITTTVQMAWREYLQDFLDSILPK